MNNNFHDHRPSLEEERAYAEALQHFGEQVKQFASSRAAIERLDHDAPLVAEAIITATGRTAPGANPRLQTPDGATWRQAAALMDNLGVYYRVANGEMQFAVVEHLPSNDTHDVIAKAHRAQDVLCKFVRDQQQVLQTWAEDIGAQVCEHLAEKYPGQDMKRVYDAFMHWLAQPISENQAVAQSQKQNRGMRS